MHGVLDYIKKFLPALAIFENVRAVLYNEITEEVFRSLRPYGYELDFVGHFANKCKVIHTIRFHGSCFVDNFGRRKWCTAQDPCW